MKDSKLPLASLTWVIRNFVLKVLLFTQGLSSAFHAFVKCLNYSEGGKMGYHVCNLPGVIVETQITQHQQQSSVDCTKRDDNIQESLGFLCLSTQLKNWYIV